MSSEWIKAECIRKATAILTTGRRHEKKPLTAKDVIECAKELEKYVTKQKGRDVNLDETIVEILASCLSDNDVRPRKDEIFSAFREAGYMTRKELAQDVEVLQEV